MERIARAVISQALRDAGIGTPAGERRTVHPLDQDEARSFLLAEAGTWKQARFTWCSMADLDPARLRRRTAEVLSGNEPVVVAMPKQRRERAVTKIARTAKRPKPGTKLSSVLYYMSRPEGVSLDELQRHLGWNRNTAMTSVYDLRLFGIIGKRGEDGRYRIVSLP